MDTYELVVPCHFGLEAVTKREIYDLGYEITRVEDGRVTFAGDAEAICRANIFLRSAERVLLQVGRFRATTFDELFEGIKALPWEDYIPKDGKFWVKKASSIKSKLFSPSDIQSIAKKAMVERLKNVYRLNWFPEDGAPYPVRIFLLKDEVMVTLDTSGDSLHKRGYRLMTSKAPLTETLAAALIMLTPWKKDRILVDPFCGSGTFPIEAAMIAANIAPGMNRQFTAEQWKNLIPKQLWYDTVEEAQDLMDADIQVDIQGYDIDAEVVKAARENGERLEEKEDLPELYTQIGQAYAGLDSWSLYMITSYEDAERYIGRKADKNRKIYNGMIKTYFYQFMGPKPSKRREAAEKTIERKEQQ